jgi:hypothetical protein
MKTADNHLNDNQIIFPNPIFDASLKTHEQETLPVPNPR